MTPCCQPALHAASAPDPPLAGAPVGVHAFRPERFLEGQGGTYTWIPFGGGVRRCLGATFAQLEMRIVLQTLVRRLDLRAADRQPERMIRRALALAPARGGEIVAHARAEEPVRDAVPAA
jgi:Cytochrome P450